MRALGINADGDAARAVMRRYDDGSGSLRLPQFRKLVEELRQFQGGGQTRSDRASREYDDIERTFRRFDDDGSGDIDVAELAKCVRSLGVNAE